jgi:hypothetical protein
MCRAALFLRQMTIDSGWVQHLKRECPAAFKPTLSTRPTTWFIDGQIKLMKGEWVNTWELFLQRQFLDTIDRAFEHNAAVVVLGFDDYTHVPLCKSMTQRDRNVKQAAFTWNELLPLPPAPPDDWAACMRCRPFKAMVIGMLVRNVRRIYKNHEKTVIIDWMGPPVVLGRALELDGRALPAEVLDPAARRGECDIKALASTAFGALVVQSTDGDFVPLALVHCEAHPERQVFLERIETRVSTGAKRTALGATKRRMEFVCVRELCAHVQGAMKPHAAPCRAFAVLVALTGCDFSQSMPAIGPAKMWSALPLMHKLDLESEHGILAAISLAYQFTFSKHIRTLPATQITGAKDLAASRAAYESVAGAIAKNAAVAQKTKSALWAPADATRHARNVLWTLQYWTELERWPDPMQAKFGFAVDAAGHCSYG